MNSGSSRRRRRSETEEQDGNESSSSSSLSPTPVPSKRPRLGVEPKSESESGSEPSSDVDESSGGPSRRSPNNAESSNGNALALEQEEFQPGAIVRVSVRNFVTYEKADFFPGPNLNMVIGPNGTGKSSLVCAICLGLGYSPKHLGRAGSVKEFVKHGKDTATIEIELQKQSRDRANYVIRVQILREQNKQKWWLNGKETTHKKIQALMRQLRIQVDNLCQFLPQDRVVEFAASTPVDLLHETLRAAAPEEMQEWHIQLQEKHKDRRELAETSRGDEETLQRLQNRQQGLQADVDRLREREQIQERVKNLRGALVMSKYEQARRNNSEAKERKKIAERSLRRLQEESGPSLEAVNRKQIYADKIESVIPSKVASYQDAIRAGQNVTRGISKAAEDIQGLENKIGAERKGFDEKKKEVAASRSKITSLQADMRSQPSDFNATEWNQKIRAEEHKLREMELERGDFEADLKAVHDKGKIKVHEMRRFNEDLVALDTREGQQLSHMKKAFPEVAAGWEWVQENQNEFEKEVFGPPMICCSIKDERYSDQVQSLLQTDDYMCFTAQTKNDYKKLSNQLYRVLSLSVVIRTCSMTVGDFRAPLGAAETAALGLDGYAADYLDGPAPVLAMLCAEKRLHQAGISLRDHTDAEYEKLVSSGTVSNWAAGRQQYMVRRRREYGPKAMTTVTKHISPGRFWTSQPIDNHEKADLNRRLAEVKVEWQMLKDERNELERKRSDYEDRKEDVRKQISDLKSEKNALQREYQKWQSLPAKIESEERLKEANEKAMRQARDNIIDLQFEWDAAVVMRAKHVLRLEDAIEAIRKAHHGVLEAKIRRAEAKSDIEGLKERNSSLMAKLEEEKENLRLATEEALRTRELGRKISDEIREMIAHDPSRKDTYGQLAEGKTPDELAADMSAEEANLELIHAANPNVIREFEKRAVEIARLTKKTESASNKMERLNHEIDDLMGKWEPQLEQLVSKISDAFAYNFEQISCAGEVRIHKDEDFDLWALDVMVKFRENETLQQLNAHRQSGGERAVSTIFYLMALQSMAQSPFRVVDEINQGMDPRNERMVHERMVEIACREHTSQYFLITPKLLTGLRYDPRMRVLCIASGEFMPKDGLKVDFARCLRLHKNALAATA